MHTLCSIALILATTSASLSAPVPGPDWKTSGPFTYQNMAIYFIHGKDVIRRTRFLTLQEALTKKQIIVHETGNVQQLEVENVSADFEVFIQAGDIVKGGRQDRVLSYDMLVPPKSGKMSIASFCVESGRWRQRGEEDARKFSESSGQLPGKALRLAVGSARQQGQVWDKVKEQQDKLSRRLNKTVADASSPTSLQLTLEDKDLRAKVDAYVNNLESRVADKVDVIGFVVAINGKIEGAEVYGSSPLFRKMWPKLLRSTAIDAFVEQQKGRRYELADSDELRSFLVAGNEGKSTETKVDRRIHVTTRENATTLSIETRDQDHQGAMLHRSYLAR